MENTVAFREKSRKERIFGMLRVDLRRMLRNKTFYILIAAALIIPILITVMTTMMDGTVSVDVNTGKETVMEGPESTWESIGSLPGASAQIPEGGDAMSAMGGMDVMSMCNINMMFMLVAVFVCIFISDDFRSGYAKNLFTVRSKRGDYVISKTVAGFIAGALMIVFYFIGALIGGAVCSLSFEMVGFGAFNLLLCILSKIFLMLVFVSIFTVISIAAKQKAWLSILASLGGGMLLFMMVPMITPLDSGMMNVILTLGGGVLFAIGLGVISKKILEKTSVV